MKAILVIEMPKCCYLCPCFSITECMAYKCGTKVEDDRKRPDWCPLKPMSSKKQEKHYCSNGIFGINTAMGTRFNQGYNACIDEILGDKEREDGPINK